MDDIDETPHFQHSLTNIGGRTNVQITGSKMRNIKNKIVQSKI